MVDLLDRIQNPNRPDDEGLPDNEKTITVHSYTGSVTLATLGKVTQAQIDAEFNIEGDALAQENEIIAVYNGKTANQKIDYLQCLIATFLVYEQGIVNKAQAETILEI